MIYLETGESGYITGICSVEIAGSTEFAGELPDGFEAGFPYYRLMEGKLVYDGEKQAETEKKRERTERIAELKGLLAATDYIAAKISEGAATREEYAEKLAERQSWRDEINELEGGK